MEAIDLAEIKAAAEKATPGPWFVSGVRSKLAGGTYHQINRYDEAKKDDENIAAVGYNERTGLGYADAQFIALCNPATILALVTELQQHRADPSSGKGEAVASADWKAGYADGYAAGTRDTLAFRAAPMEAGGRQVFTYEHSPMGGGRYVTTISNDPPPPTLWCRIKGFTPAHPTPKATALAVCEKGEPE